MPAVVLPFHDPHGLCLPHLHATTSQLKRLFSRAFLSVSLATEQEQAAALESLRADPFFCLNDNQPGSGPGDHYRAAYASAVAHSPPGDSLHLCDVDKLVCYLQGSQRVAFVADLEQASAEERPVLFQRSPLAWCTYPRHYRDIEQRAMRTAEPIFGSPIDVAWSYLVIRAADLGPLLPGLSRHDYGLLPELALRLRPSLILRPVDWLVWEDPFIYHRPTDELMAERDNDPAETRKRLLWLATIMEVLLASAKMSPG